MKPADETHSELTSSQLFRLNEVAADFAECLRDGLNPRIDDYIRRVESPLQDRLREELVGEAFEHRFGDPGKYRVVGSLGSGAFGEVYEALQKGLERPVAIKVLTKSDAHHKRAFEREAKRQAKLNHPSLVQVHDFGTLPKGHPFLVMEYIDGGTLRQKLEKEAPLAPEDAGRIAEQIARALGAVHVGTAGSRHNPCPPMVHQDLKPDNILIDGRGAHVADFGLAAAVTELHERTAGVGGSAPYMSPEQAMAAIRPGMAPPPVDPRSDIWALGVILYEMLSGHQPFTGDNRDDVLDQIIKNSPTQLHTLSKVPAELEQLVDDCLKKEPSERVQSALKVTERLESWLDSVASIPRIIDFSSVLDERRRGFVDRPWLFDEVDAWMVESNRPILLLTGEPGCGKSAFLAELIHRNPQNQIVAWHVCRDWPERWPETRSAAHFVRSLAGMLATNVTSYRVALASEDIRESLRIDKCHTNPADAFENAIVTPIAKAKPPGPGAYLIVVDGLDEADLSSDVSIPWLLANWERRLPPWLRIIASVRRGGLVPDPFSGVPPFSIDRQNAKYASEVQDDVLRYARERLQEPNLAERLVQEQMRAEDAAQTLLDRSERNFLYVFEALKGIEHDLYSFRRLGDLPPGLDRLYHGFFQRQWPTKKQYSAVRPILEVMLAAQEPIAEELLAGAVDMNRYELSERLAELDQYLHAGPDSIGLGNRAIGRWLARTKSHFKVASRQGHERLRNACWHEYECNVPLSRYSLRHVLPHLVDTEQWERIERLMTDLSFLERKVEAGMTFDLADDFACVVAKMPTELPGRRILELLEEGLRRDLVFISRHPSTLFQCMWNTCWWYDCPEAERHYEIEPQRDLTPLPATRELRPHSLLRDLWQWLRRSAASNISPVIPSSPADQQCKVDPPENNGQEREGLLDQPMSKLMESWRRLKTETKGDFCWLRSLRPPSNRLGERLVIIGRHHSWVRALAVSADGKWIASSSKDSTLRVWNCETGECKWHLNLPDAETKAVAFSPDAELVVSIWHGSGEDGSGEDGSLVIWNLGTNCYTAASIRCESMRGGESIVFLPSGLLLTVRRDAHHIAVMHFDLQDPLSTTHTLEVEHGSCSAVSPDGRRIAIGGGFRSGCALWHRETGKQLAHMTYAGSPDSVAFSPDGSLVALGWNDGNVMIWNPVTDPMVRVSHHFPNEDLGRTLMLRGHSCYAHSVAFSPNGEILASGASDGTVRIWDIRTGRELRCLRSRGSRVFAVAFSADGRRVISGWEDGYVRSWDISGDCSRAVLPHQEEKLTSVSFSPDGRSVVSGSNRGSLRVWDVNAGNEHFFLGRANGNGWRKHVHCVAFSPDSRLVAAGVDNQVEMWDVVERKTVGLLNVPKNAYSVAFSPDGGLVAVGSGEWWHRESSDGGVHVFNRRSGVVVGYFVCHLQSVHCVAFSPDGKYVVSGSSNGQTSIWDIESGDEVRRFADDDNDLVFDVAFTPNGRDVVRVGGGKVHICAVDSGECVRTLDGWGNARAIANSLPYRATLHADGIEIESVASGRSIGWWPDQFINPAIHPSGRIWASDVGNYLCLFALEDDG